jgi:endonuclease/exonuclease/phosphatase family metal-dependent hydrolase
VRLRLVTFNCQDLYLPQGALSTPPVDAAAAGVRRPTVREFERRIDALAELLLDANGDVLALQEVGDEGALDALLRAVGDSSYPHRVLGIPDVRGIRPALVSRAPFLTAEVLAPSALSLPVFVDGDPAPWPERLALRRGVIRAVVPWAAVGPVHVITAHFKSRLPMRRKSASGVELPAETALDHAEGLFRSMLWRSAEALFVRRLADELFSGDRHARLCVCGDFNDEPSSPTLRMLVGRGDGRLIDATEDIPPSERVSLSHGGIAMQLDHALVSPALADHVAAVRFLGTLTDDGCVAPRSRVVASDHRPLAVEFAPTLRPLGRPS